MIVHEVKSEIFDPDRKIRVAGYCRVSTKKDDQVHSFAAQIRHFRDLISEMPNAVLVDIYADEGITGTSMEKRDEFMRMINDCKLGKIDKIITKSVSRFARNNEECLFAIRLLKEHNVSVAFEKEKIDTEMMNSEFFISVFGSVAQMESKNISDNMRWSYKHRMQSGEFITCKAPLGYKLEDRQLVIVEDEADLVRRIFDMYLSGMGIERITRTLNEENAPKRYGYDKWHVWNVRYILTNERYMGDAILQKRYTTDTLPFQEKWNHGEKEMYLVENSNPPIVTRKQFEAVQALMEFRRTMISQGQRNTSIFQGILYCSECNKKMRRMKLPNKNAWVCKEYSHQRSNCSSHMIDEEEIKEAFKFVTIKLCENREDVLVTAIEQMQKVVDIVGNHRDRIKEIDSTIAKLSKQCYALSKLYADRTLTDAAYYAKVNPLQGEMTRLRSERKNLLKMDKDEDCLTDLVSLKELIDSIQDPYSFDEEFFDEAVEKVTVDEKGNITFQLIGGMNITERGNA